MKHYLPYICIGFGAALWGLIAFFVRGLSSYGFTAMEIVAIRVTAATILLLVIGLLRFSSQIKIRMKDLPMFFGTGILSIVFFNWCYFTAIDYMPISLAVILLYTSPAFVAVLSYIFLKESLTAKKIIAVIGTITGCVLIAGLTGESQQTISIWALLIGLGSGLGYALYSIFGKFALRKYPPFTVTLYTFVVADIVLFPVVRLWEKSELLLDFNVLVYAAGLGFIPTVLAYFLYTWGLERVESSTAAVIATVEPIVATCLGVVLYHEKLTGLQIAGSLLILASVIVVNLPAGNSNFKTVEKEGS
ncbi:EamA family transporter [Bacillus methanolicus]|uniref:DMT family transporter n=1 Tax=Bacillus methanolicus TaxID=1471 RepID=UPI002380C087|nr:EamA family transporter [Bacillus methanolicus]MDE3839334.1 EamA family transporter [Bacillus methanolicus]